MNQQTTDTHHIGGEFHPPVSEDTQCPRLPNVWFDLLEKAKSEIENTLEIARVK